MSDPYLPLFIVTPHGVSFQGKCDGVFLPADKGPLGVLPGHTSFVASLADAGVVRVLQQGGKDLFFAVRGGAVEVRPLRTLVLTEFCRQAASEAEAKSILVAAKETSDTGNGAVKKAESIIMSHLSSNPHSPYNGKKE